MSEYQNLFAALAKAQGEMEQLIAGSTAIVKSDKANYSYTYADLADVLKVALKALSAHGLGIMQFPEVAYDQNGTTVTMGATLFHASGEYMVVPPLPLRIRSNATAQEVGSAITYARRYQLQSVLGLSPDDDDDGSKASNKADDKQATSQRQQPAKPQSTAQHRQPQQAPAKPAQVDSEARELADSVGAVVTVVDAALEKARKALHAEVVATFPKDDVDHARHWLIKRYTGKTTPSNVRESANDLATDELTALAGVLKSHRKTYADQWIVEKTAPIPASK